MTKIKLLFIVIMVTCLEVSFVFAQRYYDRRYSPRRTVPKWENDKDFAHDVFTFVRIRYSSGYGGRYRYALTTLGSLNVSEYAIERWIGFSNPIFDIIPV